MGYNEKDNTLERCRSWFPAAAEIIKDFHAPLHHLALDIKISFPAISDLNKVHFSPLAVLGSTSIPRIDVYVHPGEFSPTLTRAQILPSLEGYEEIMRSIREGVMVIHAGETAPEFV
jgi:hypothetical protein